MSPTSCLPKGRAFDSRKSPIWLHDSSTILGDVLAPEPVVPEAVSHADAVEELLDCDDRQSSSLQIRSCRSPAARRSRRVA